MSGYVDDETGRYHRIRDVEEKPVSEADTLRTISEYLDVLMNQGRVLWIRHNPIRVIHIGSTIRIVKGRESQKGAPDLFVFPDGYLDHKTLAVETKTKAGKLRPEQEEWKMKAEKIGLHYIVCRSFEDFREQSGL